MSRRNARGALALNIAALLEKCILPAIGSKRVTDLTRADVAKLHAKLVDVPYEANRVLALISVVWTWAARREEVDAAANPARGVERYP